MMILTLYPHRWLLGLLVISKAFDNNQLQSANNTTQVPTRAPVRCRQCRHVITTQENAIELAGQHQHVFTNPASVTFTILLFRYAQCLVQGMPTREHTWFNGYAWQLAHCGQCQSHLGWYFSHPEFPDFYGLIRAQLIHE